MKSNVRNMYLWYTVISSILLRMYRWNRHFSSCDRVRTLDGPNGHTFYRKTSNSPITSSSRMLSSFCSPLVNRVSIPLKYLKQKVPDSFIRYASPIDSLRHTLVYSKPNYFNVHGVNPRSFLDSLLFLYNIRSWIWVVE